MSKNQGYSLIWPYGIDIIDYADNLIIDFPDENLPILRDPEEWKDWATIVSSTGVFAERGVPSPIKTNEEQLEESSDEWQDWAKGLYTIMIVYNKN